MATPSLTALRNFWYIENHYLVIITYLLTMREIFMGQAQNRDLAVTQWFGSNYNVDVLEDDNDEEVNDDDDDFETAAIHAGHSLVFAW